MQQSAPSAGSGKNPPARGLLVPGRNCWRIERSDRVAFLIDGAAYFAAVRSALAKARHSILVLGWDIDSRMRLVPEGAGDGLPEPLGDFLNAIIARRRELHGYVLSWDFAMLYAMEREWLPIYKLDWRTHRRLSFRLDDRHPEVEGSTRPLLRHRSRHHRRHGAAVPDGNRGVVRGLGRGRRR